MTFIIALVVGGTWAYFSRHAIAELWRNRNQP